MPRHFYDSLRRDSLLDEVSAEQYATTIPARIRREHMEQTANPALRDFNGIVFKHAEINPWDTVLDVGFGDGVDLLKLADPFGEFNHQGILLGMEIPQPKSATAALDGLEVDRHLMFKDTMAAYGKGNYLMVPDGYVQHKIERRSGSVDVVIAANVLQHVKSKSQLKALENIWEILRPGGKLIAITNGPNNKRRFHAGMERTAYLLNASYGGPLSRKFYPQRALDLLPRAGFRVDRSIGLSSGVQEDFADAEYHDHIKITKDNLNLLISAAYTYLPSLLRRAGQPAVTQDEFRAALDEAMLSRVQQEITLQNASYDILERWAVIAHKPS